ncbi:MAG: polysaccharide biosynthesis tyrosine autokinase [Vicinamibacterales bacterium]
MGRVDDALRRAAEADAREGAQTVRTAAPAGIADDIEVLAREAFPIEIDEHRKAAPRPGPTAVAPPAPTVAPDLKVRPTYENPVRPANDAPASVPTPAPATIPAARSVFERVDSSLVGKIVIDAEIAPNSREQYRRMAATLHHAQAANGLKVVMVTSAVMGEGKTLTSSNLALTLSESYKKNVLLIDGDLRRPALHTLFRLESSPGLSEGLFAGEDQRLAVRQVSPRLGVLTAGRPSSDPIAGLTSPRMARVIEEAREAFDWVIIDTPPVALLPDANLLATMADGAVLVVRAGATPWDLAQRAVEAIGRERMLGVVLNRSSEQTQGSSYGYYDYYSGEPGTDVVPKQ